MNDLRQIVSPIAIVIVAGAVLIFGQQQLEHKSQLRSGRPAIAVASSSFDK